MTTTRTPSELEIIESYCRGFCESLVATNINWKEYPEIEDIWHWFSDNTNLNFTVSEVGSQIRVDVYHGVAGDVCSRLITHFLFHITSYGKAVKL